MAEDASAKQIADAAAKPKSVTVEGQTISRHSIPDQIAADRYLREKNAQSAGAVFGGVKRARIGGGSPQ